MNTALIKSINSAVSKVVAARRLYGDAYTEANILPKHEETVVALIENSARTVGSFAGTAPNTPATRALETLAQTMLPPSEVTGFRQSDGTINSDPQLLANYAAAYEAALNGNPMPVPPNPGFDVIITTTKQNGPTAYSGVTTSYAINPQYAHPVTGADVLNTAYAGSTQTIANALTTAMASLASQRDALKAQLQTSYNSVAATIASALTAAVGNSAQIAALNQQKTAADQALASGLSGIDSDYNSAVAQAQQQANLQQQAIAANLTDIVAAQGITAVQNQLSNLLLNPIASPNVSPTAPYPTPTFTAPPPPYTISGFNPLWDTQNGVFYTTIYDYGTQSQATAYASSATGNWINEATGAAVQGPAGSSVPFPTATFQYPNPPNTFQSTPTWDTTYGIWKASMFDQATGTTVVAFVASATSQWINNATGNPVVAQTTAPPANPASQTPLIPVGWTVQTAPAYNSTTGYWTAVVYDYNAANYVTAYWVGTQWVNANSQLIAGLPPSPTAPSPLPPTTAGSGVTYSTDAQGNVWMTDPTTGQTTLYMSGTGTTTAPTDQSGSVPQDYYEFSDTGAPPAASSPPAATSAPQYGLGDDGNYYVLNTTTGQWDYYGPGPGVAAPAAPVSTPPPATVSGGSSRLFGWNFGFGSMVSARGQFSGQRRLPRQSMLGACPANYTA